MNGVVFRTADPVFPLTEVAVAGGCSGSCEYLAALATRVILINWGSAHVLHRESLAWTGALRERVHARRQRHGVAQHRGRPLCVFSYYPTPAGAAGWAASWLGCSVGLARSKGKKVRLRLNGYLGLCMATKARAWANGNKFALHVSKANLR
jgi:hypothetical protein